MKQTVRHPVLRSRLRPIAVCFLAWNIFLPDGATAAESLVTGGTYTDINIYGNTGTSALPINDLNASGNALTLDSGSDGPHISSYSKDVYVNGG